MGEVIDRFTPGVCQGLAKAHSGSVHGNGIWSLEIENSRMGVFFYK